MSSKKKPEKVWAFFYSVHSRFNSGPVVAKFDKEYGSWETKDHYSVNKLGHDAEMGAFSSEDRAEVVKFMKGYLVAVAVYAELFKGKDDE
jgi:hypothetical protein